MAPFPRLEAAIQDLSQTPNLVRIKKLLFYACTGNWENDPGKVHFLNLRELVQHLLEINPTLEQLQWYLEGIVQTLNKQADYTLVANTLIGHLQQVYGQSELDQGDLDQDELTRAIAPASGFSTSPYGAIGQSLEQDSDVIRLKKLLFCTCRQTWENDLETLNQCSLADLVQEIHGMAPTLEQAQQQLSNVVLTLNKQAQYEAIAHRLLQQLEPLYITTPLALVANHYAHPTVAEHHIPPEPHSLPVAAPIVTAPVKSLADPLAVFNLRLDVMKYANPLRAKILAITALYEPVDLDDAGWSTLKAHQLDDLLCRLVERFEQIKTLEARLEHVARHLREADQYGAVVGAIVRAVRPFYSQQPDLEAAALSPASSLDQTRQAEATGLKQLQDEEDNTCQFFSSAMLSSLPSHPSSG